jgi:hypothetical protein
MLVMFFTQSSHWSTPMSAIPSQQLFRRKSAELNLASHCALPRALLILGCIAAAAIAAWLGQPERYLEADVALAHVLRGMALIKASIVVAAIAVLLWRFRHPLSPRMAAFYLAGVWLLAGASMMIWQLTLIPVAAISFHVGAIALLVAAWRDHGEVSRDQPDSTRGRANWWFKRHAG